MSVAASLQVKLDMDSTGFSSGVTAAESRLDKFKNKVDSVSASMRDIGGKATAALTVPIVAGFGSAINAASDLNEATSAVETTYGSAAAAIIASSKNAATAVGQSQEQYLSAATTLGVFGKSAGLTGDDLSGFSNDLLGASGDLASFFNADP